MENFTNLRGANAHIAQLERDPEASRQADWRLLATTDKSIHAPTIPGRKAKRDDDLERQNDYLREELAAAERHAEHRRGVMGTLMREHSDLRERHRDVLFELGERYERERTESMLWHTAPISTFLASRLRRFWDSLWM